MALRKCGFRCSTAMDGTEAVQMVTKQGLRFDVVLMDQMMKVALPSPPAYPCLSPPASMSADAH